MGKRPSRPSNLYSGGLIRCLTPREVTVTQYCCCLRLQAGLGGYAVTRRSVSFWNPLEPDAEPVLSTQTSTPLEASRMLWTLLLAAGTTATTATPLSSRGIALTHAGVYKGVVAVSTAVQKTEFPTREPSQDIKLVKLVQRYYYYFRYGIQPITSTSWFRHPKCLHHGSNDVVLSVIAEYPRTSRIN